LKREAVSSAARAPMNAPRDDSGRPSGSTAFAMLGAKFFDRVELKMALSDIG